MAPSFWGHETVSRKQKERFCERDEVKYPELEVCKPHEWKGLDSGTVPGWRSVLGNVGGSTRYGDEQGDLSARKEGKSLDPKTLRTQEDSHPHFVTSCPRCHFGDCCFFISWPEKSYDLLSHAGVGGATMGSELRGPT